MGNGLAFKLGFTATRFLEDVKLKHVKQNYMTYFGKYGSTLAETLLNISEGEVKSAVTAPSPANIVLGSNYLTSSANNLSAGLNIAEQEKKLDCSIFSVFNAGDVTVLEGSGVAVASLWGTSPDRENNPGRLSIVLYRDSSGTPYIVLKWGRGIDLPTLSCAVPLNWTTVVGKIFAMGSRDSSGNLVLEVRADGVTYKQSATVSPIPIPSATTDWRGYIGQLYSMPINSLKMYSSAIWSSKLSADEISSEMDIMEVVLNPHLSK